MEKNKSWDLIEKQDPYTVTLELYVLSPRLRENWLASQWIS